MKSVPLGEVTVYSRGFYKDCYDYRTAETCVWKIARVWFHRILFLWKLRSERLVEQMTAPVLQMTSEA